MARRPITAKATTTVSSSTRRKADTDLPKKEKTMQATQDPGKAQEVFTQASTKALETMTVWAESNQRVLRELVELSAGTAKEGIRLYAELQQGAIDAIREGQSAALRWQSSWQDAPKDPVSWYQKSLAESVDGAQKWFRFMESNAQAMTKYAERLQASAEQAGKTIQESVGGVVHRVKDVYATA